MSFRYKSALLSLASLVLLYGWYFASWIADRHTGLHTGPHTGLHTGAHGAEPWRLAVTVVAIVVVQVIGTIFIAVTAPDRWGGMDERERGFDRRATNAGYYVLIVAVLAAAATSHLGAHSHDMADAILLAVVVAECARQAVFLLSHHKAV